MALWLLHYQNGPWLELCGAQRWENWKLSPEGPSGVKPGTPPHLKPRWGEARDPTTPRAKVGRSPGPYHTSGQGGAQTRHREWRHTKNGNEGRRGRLFSRASFSKATAHSPQGRDQHGSRRGTEETKSYVTRTKALFL